MSSDRWVPRSKSHWSSERDRARRNRKDQATSREPAKGNQPDEPSQDSDTTEQPQDQPSQRSSTERIDRLTADLGRGSRPSRASRSSQTSEPSGGSPEPQPSKLPDLPGNPGSGKPGGNRVLVLGALLFIAMAMIAVLPRFLGDGGNTDPTPTPELIQTPTPRSQVAAAPISPTQSVEDADQVVCIDAGHGGWDPGRERQANSRAPMMEESDINLGMAWMLKERLEQEGIGVVMTRPDGLAVNTFNQDVNGDGQTLQDSEQSGERDELQARINICNEANADLLISIHLNGFDDPSARGYEVLYTPAPFREFGDRNADLATFVYRQIDAAYKEVGFETQPRGTLPDTELEAQLHAYGSERHLVMTGPAVSNADYTITPSNMPGIVIEPVFVTNDDDAAFIAETENQKLLVDAYADGILDYFERYPDGL